MTWISLCYVFLSFLLAWGLGTNNYQHWPQRIAVPIQNYGQSYGDPQNAAMEAGYNSGQDNGFNEYTDNERSNFPRPPGDQEQWQPPALPKDVSSFKSPYSVAPDWPTSNKKFGQISAVCFDQDGNVVVFHRGDHTWNAQSFLRTQVYNQKDLGPIEDNTIVVLDSTTGNVLHEWGNNLFFLPHGLTIDGESNVWLTDVALHQVFKFPPKGESGQPLLVLGTRFEPGDDDLHFCKPTSVAVTSSGDFFVSDGYCNHRIIKFNASGKKLLVWGRSNLPYGMASHFPPPNAFAIPHALALAEDKGILCVADRENGRIQCFSVLNGTYISQIKLPEFGTTKIFSVAYSPIQGGLLYAVSGDLSVKNAPDSMLFRGFVIGLSSQQLVTEFTPNLEGFHTAHDLTVSPDGKQIFVVELNPPRLWKFTENDGNTLLQFPSSRLKIAQSTISTVSQSTPIPTMSSTTSIFGKNMVQNSTHSLPIIEPAPHILSLSLQVLIAISTIIALVVAAILFVFVRRRGPWCSCWICYKRWQFRRAPSDGFKLGSLLDPHSGFEQVCTEMSDEEEIDAAAAATGSGNNGLGGKHTIEPRA